MAANPTFDMENVVRGVIAQCDSFVSVTGAIALGIYALLFVFHLVEGGAELMDPRATCRFVSNKFYLRLILVGAVTAGYKPIVVGTSMSFQPKVMMSFAANWANIWQQENTAIANLREAESQNQDVKFTGIAKTKTGKDDDSWGGKLAVFLVDGLITGVGWVVSVAVGLAITALILMEGLFGLGITTILIGIGPICFAFAAHEKTEGFLWTWLKAFLVFGLLYMPVLGFSCGIAGVVMARITSMAVDSGMTYGDGSDVGMHFVMVVLGPLCGFAVVKGAPALLSAVIGGASFGAAGGAFQSLQNAMSRGGGGSGASKPPPDDDDKKKKPDNNDSSGKNGGGSSSSSGGQGDVASEIAKAIRGE